jgi:hypothetical protein
VDNAQTSFEMLNLGHEFWIATAQLSDCIVTVRSHGVGRDEIALTRGPLNLGIGSTFCSTVERLLDTGRGPLLDLTTETVRRASRQTDATVDCSTPAACSVVGRSLPDEDIYAGASQVSSGSLP